MKCAHRSGVRGKYYYKSNIKGNMTEYYPGCDMLSTDEISNIAYEYYSGMINFNIMCIVLY